MTQDNLALIVDGAISLAVIAAGAVLGALGKIDGQTTLAVIGVGVALVKGSVTTAMALRVPVPPRPVSPPPAPAPAG